MLASMFMALSFLGAGSEVILIYPTEIVVIDGDTLRAGPMRLRLAGIDAPEMSQPGGKEARAALKDLVANGSMITCRLWSRDRYQRHLATCYNIGGDDFNWKLVEGGYAFAYRKYALTYGIAEDRAKAAHRGVWSGAVEYPWDYRARRRGR